jgi:hypothetical protein
MLVKIGCELDIEIQDDKKLHPLRLSVDISPFGDCLQEMPFSKHD